MQTHHTLPASPPWSASSVTFGDFDGVHLGHRALIAALAARRAQLTLGGPLVVVTFDPHPLALLRPADAPAQVDTLAGRLAWLARCGVDHTVVLRFDADLATRSARWFVEEALLARLAAGALVVGPDAHFGHRGAGDVGLLRRFAGARGVDVTVCPGVEIDGERVSSSRLRRVIAQGEVGEARRLLARPFCLRGEVVHGDGRGRLLGFPTANIDASSQVQPAPGVYACLFAGAGTAAPHAAVANVGVRPTFGPGAAARVEAHLLDWQGDLYGAQVDLHVIARLRGERRFDSVAALQAQIAQDVAVARELLAEPAGGYQL